MQSKSWSRLSRKTWQIKWKQEKKCGSYEEGEKNLSLQSPCFGLPTFCWLLVVRKWERARFSPPENNTNPSKLKSNTQSTSQETILKRKTSQWELHLNAAGMRCLAPPPPTALSRLQPQPNPNHTTSQTTRLPFSHSLSISLIYSFLSFFLCCSSLPCSPSLCLISKILISSSNNKDR